MRATIAATVADAVADLTALGTDQASVTINWLGIAVHVSTYEADDVLRVERWDAVLRDLGGEWNYSKTAYGPTIEGDGGTLEATSVRNGVRWKVWVPLESMTSHVIRAEVVPV